MFIFKTQNYIYGRYREIKKPERFQFLNLMSSKFPTKMWCFKKHHNIFWFGLQKEGEWCVCESTDLCDRSEWEHIKQPYIEFFFFVQSKMGNKTAQPLQVTLWIKHEILIRDILYFLVKHTPIMFVYNFEYFFFLNVWLWKTKKVFCSVVYMV